MKTKYTITIDFGSEKVSGKGETILDALQSLNHPEKIVGKTFVTIEEGKRKAEVMYLPSKAKRLFYPNSQFLIAKQYELLLK